MMSLICAAAALVCHRHTQTQAIGCAWVLVDAPWDKSHNTAPVSLSSQHERITYHVKHRFCYPACFVGVGLNGTHTRGHCSDHPGEVHPESCVPVSSLHGAAAFHA